MQLIEARHRKMKAEAQQAYSEKLKNIQNNFNRSYERCLQQREEKSKLNEEKTLKKYQAYYWLKREQNDKRKEKKRIYKDKIALKKERIEQIEKEHDAKRKAIMRKLKNITKKKEEHDKEKESIIMKNKQIQYEHYEKLQQNQSEILQKQLSKREEILILENEKINRALHKDNGAEIQKTNARIATISDQISFGEEMKEFLKKMNNIMDNSVMKKSKVQKIKMYKDKIRKEEEQRRKEEEEKLNQM